MSSTLKQAMQALKGRIADAYTAISNKGGTLPATQDSANLSAAIASIPSGGTTPFYTGHIDETGLRAIGWLDSDLEWFQEQVDWMAEDDDSFKVPQQLIDAYNAYMTEHGVVDSTFVTTNKTQWWFRYCPYIASSPYQMCQNATYMIAAPSNIYNVRWDYNTLSCNSLRYIPKLYKERVYNPYGWADVFRNCRGGATLDVEINIMDAVHSAMFYQSSFNMLKLKVNTASVDLNFQNAPNSVRILDIDVPRVKPNTTSTGLTASCAVCRIKGLCGNLRLAQAYISKSDLLYIINGETTQEGESVVLTMNATMYGVYSVDIDVLAALTNHPRVSLASV